MNLRFGSLLPLRSHPFDAGLDALLNHRSFELRKDPHHPKESLPGRRGGIDALLMNEEINFLCVDLGEEIDQVREGPSQPIDRPHHHHLELAADRSLPECIEGGTVFSAFGATDPLVHKFQDDEPPVPLGREAKFAELAFRRGSLACFLFRLSFKPGAVQPFPLFPSLKPPGLGEQSGPSNPPVSNPIKT